VPQGKREGKLTGGGDHNGFMGTMKKKGPWDKGGEVDCRKGIGEGQLRKKGMENKGQSLKKARGWGGRPVNINKREEGTESILVHENCRGANHVNGERSTTWRKGGHQKEKRMGKCKKGLNFEEKHEEIRKDR